MHPSPALESARLTAAILPSPPAHPPQPRLQRRTPQDGNLA